MSRADSEATRSGHPRVVGWGILATVILASALAAVAAPPAIDEPNTYAGDFWSRPRLTGDWGGLRDALATRGIRFDVDLLLSPQGVATGGFGTGAAFWGNAEYTLNVDTGKAGLWPGGSLQIKAISGFGETVTSDLGSLAFVNTGYLLPNSNAQGTGLEGLTFTQLVGHHVSFVAGKVFAVDGFQGEFSGNFRTQFLNTALTLPLVFALAPLSAYGGGVEARPWEGMVLSAMVLDPTGTAMNNDVSEAFRDGVLVLAGAKVAIKPFGLVGHQSVSGLWSNMERPSLTQDPSNIGRQLVLDQFPGLNDPGPVLQRFLERFFPGLLVPVAPFNEKSDTWAVLYSFDQYLWQPTGDPKRGVGIFFTFGVSDGNPNPIKYSYSMGIGGNGAVPGRPNDNFGLGWARTELSGQFVPFLRQRLPLGLDREDAIEMYYNAALTRWLNVTVDLQIVNPALKKDLGSDGQLRDVNTAVVAGLRIYSRF